MHALPTQAIPTGIFWCHCRGVSAGFYEKRWMAQYPFQKRILWNYWTVGEILLIVFILAIGGLAGNAWYPSAKYTGILAGGSMIFIWLLAMHNSIWTFLLGLPFERALWWHMFFVYVTVFLGAYHGVVGQMFDKEGRDMGRWNTQENKFRLGSGMYSAISGA